MKKLTSVFVTCAVATALSSCGGVGFGDYLGCLLSPGDVTTEECLIGKTIDGAVNSLLADVETTDSLEKAENLASTMDTLLTAIEAAQSLKMDVPESAKKAYNSALSRIQKHNYFNSEQLRTSLQNARAL